jgi:hypothetical protein
VGKAERVVVLGGTMVAAEAGPLAARGFEGGYWLS